ncbi:VOC family protein [Brachybacterium alimentarium]|nr:VOC family protein [Brachybacterium alimentarium]PCC30751.1 glyoxalase [Brachybacterium alimentarium]RCS67520.1 VOC family protein [Brachybacterium alimentarium]RCS76397.1 VOC family protein [Brachybacterium alimentarium]RCS80105.1 VOC family protein [Brachybacterium alimentarium]
MGIRRMDHVGIIVEDLDAMARFFTALGMELEGRTEVSGRWAERVTGLPGMRTEIAMLAMPDGTGRIELSQFATPAAVGVERPKDEPHGLGYRSVMFEVEDVEESVAQLLPHGAELIGEIVEYEQAYRLCYLRGPEGIIVALAEPLG